MVNENLINLINNNKQVELVQELKDYEIKKSPLSPTARAKVIRKWGGDYVSENKEGYGPMYRDSSSTSFTIRYSFSHGGGNEKLFFERFGVYSTELKISGDLWGLRNELQKLENGEIRVFNLVGGRHYERDRDLEESVKENLKRDIRNFEEEVRNLGSNECRHFEVSSTISKIF